MTRSRSRTRSLLELVLLLIGAVLSGIGTVLFWCVYVAICLIATIVWMIGHIVAVGDNAKSWAWCYLFVCSSLFSQHDDRGQ